MDTPYIRDKNNNQKELTHQLNESDELLKQALQDSSLGITVAHVDCELRYTFIYSSHPNVCAEDLLGKRDDEIDFNKGTFKLLDLKKKVIESGVAERSIILFSDMSGEQTFYISVTPLYDGSGHIKGATSVSVDITDLIKSKDIPQALAEKNGISGILSLCSFCKDVRNDNGDWEKIEAYISHHSEAQISHGICPQCMEIKYPDVHEKYTKFNSTNTDEKDK